MDKDIKGITEELLPIADLLILTKSRVAERALEPSRIKKIIGSRNKRLILTKSVEDSLKVARLEAVGNDLILITGSLFIVGEARELLLGSQELSVAK